MKRTTSNFRPLGLPYTETKDFELVTEEVLDGTVPSGRGFMYSLYNKVTKQIELRGTSLSLAIVVMQNQQQMFDKVLSGEMNGFANVQGQVALPPVDTEL